MSETEAPQDQPAPQVAIESADTVNVPAQGSHLPYVHVIAAVSVIVLLAFAGVTWWVLNAPPSTGIDAATKGSVIQTWNNLAIMAAGFWVGSSLAGKLTSARGGR